jgi:hypothetical protein
MLDTFTRLLLRTPQYIASFRAKLRRYLRAARGDPLAGPAGGRIA